MADYKELLRRAIAALPENNGAARRAVYEKARSALVGQLRAINPPLPARDITQHRLQLEDCIRQVEQEASEAVITLNRAEASKPAPVPRPQPEPAPVVAAPPPAAAKAEPSAPPKVQTQPPAPKLEPANRAKADASEAKPATAKSKPQEAPHEVPPADDAPVAGPDQGKLVQMPVGPKKPPAGESIEAIIAAAEGRRGDAGSRSSEGGDDKRRGLRVFSSEPMPRAEGAGVRIDQGDVQRSVAAVSSQAVVAGALPSTGAGGAGLARKADIEPIVVVEEQPVETALSSVREVEVEPADEASQAEGAISRAIATLDRAARGEETGEEPADRKAKPLANAIRGDVEPEARESEEPEDKVRRGSGLTIFLIVFALLLAGVGGAGFWAWREGYIDLDQMFGRTAVVADAADDMPLVTDMPTIESTEPSMPVVAPNPQVTEEATGPGNTATETTTPEPTSALEGLVDDDRLPSTPSSDNALPALGSTDAADPAATESGVEEERLTTDDTEIALADDLASSVDPANLAGSQSLLLEAAENGQSGAVPFSGTVDWSQGTDEIGLPTLLATASIPARNLEVDIVIRRNSDPGLPASHLMEVTFNTPDTFAGGGISGLPGVLLKDQELVQGTPLVGASARVVGSSFLFALSASEEDAETNRALLMDRRWMDLAVVYSTGRPAIITLEKDDAAVEMFDTVFAAWQQADADAE
jgi:hypothetical protein